ncbi:MAG: hypothetical protein ACRDT0_25930, partial [Pseudonocardiaceae bacterium]
AATVMVEQIQAWDRQARSGPAPTFAYWPTGTDRTQISEGHSDAGKDSRPGHDLLARSGLSATAGQDAPPQPRKSEE